MACYGEALINAWKIEVRPEVGFFRCMRAAKKMALMSTVLAVLTGCISADMGIVSGKARTIDIGTPQEELLRVMGRPKKRFHNPETGVAYLHFCEYGLVTDDDNGFFIYKDRVFDKVRNVEDVEWTKGIRDNWREAGAQFNCHHGIEVNWDLTPRLPKDYTETNYNIDLLRISVREKIDSSVCHAGSIYNLYLYGQISPDSSFALEKLLSKLTACRTAEGRVVHPLTVSLSSNGGLLKDGYAAGHIFRKYGVTTRIENAQGCASSCAVAFLGGARRVVEETGSIMFHAPYFTGQNTYGERDPNCDVGEKALNELNDYYQEITNINDGKRLFERTMWYCSAQDGWVVTGGPAAELFGVATEK
jgi:hypothetical protein